MKKLWKTTLVVWSDIDPDGSESSDVVREAEEGTHALITKDETVAVERPQDDPDFEEQLTEFFDLHDGDKCQGDDFDRCPTDDSGKKIHLDGRVFVDVETNVGVESVPLTLDLLDRFPFTLKTNLTPGDDFFRDAVRAIEDDVDGHDYRSIRVVDRGKV